MSTSLIPRRVEASNVASVCALWAQVLPPHPDLPLAEVLGGLVTRGLVTGRGLFSTEGECLAVGLSCFLREDTVEIFIREPRPYLNLRLLKAVAEGDASDFLTVEEIAAQNAGAGLDLFVLEYVQVTFDFDDPLAHTLLSQIVPLYLANHAGYNLRRTFHETEVAKGTIQESGGNRRLFDLTPDHPWSVSPDGLGPRAVYGLTREDAAGLAPTQIAKVPFAFTRPTLSLIPREQQILSLALEGLTDQEIGEHLGISRDGVRNRWRSLYDHIETVAPATFGPDESRRGQEAARGAEKRRRVLALVKDRPEELRPYTLKRSARA
ncbi:MAG: LuxR C-terminal-related transcriptional regulator [Pseudomonadota bacterium]